MANICAVTKTDTHTHTHKHTQTHTHTNTHTQTQSHLQTKKTQHIASLDGTCQAFHFTCQQKIEDEEGQQHLKGSLHGAHGAVTLPPVRAKAE